MLIVGGQDRHLYVYNDHLPGRELLKTMHSRDVKISGHTNRIYSIKAHPDDPNLVFSAGWDNSLKIYDIKTGMPVASIAGPEISGDCLDVYGDMILSGSYRNHNTLQIFSVSQKRLIFNFEFYTNKTVTNPENGFLLGARFSHCGNFIFAGGAGKNEFKVFLNNCDSTASFKPVMDVGMLHSPIVNIDASKRSSLVAFALGDG
jgi:COMPASS component SWD3